ncbi:MAG: dTMP kinase [Pseudomonadota bacterium]
MQFFTFEGGEGSGKSTQAKMLYQAFLNAKLDTILTREPGGSESAEIIRNLLLNEDTNFYPITELLLHNASRYQHARDKIFPALKEKKVVICDRFVDSTMAYQGYGHRIGKKMPALLHNLFMEGLAPDLTFILDIDPSEGLRRANLNNPNRYEKLGLEFHTRVREGFLEIANMAKNRCVLMQANDSIENIHRLIVDTVNMYANLDLKPIK